ncbi:hypothetical protein TURU_127449 [Turdus rufiventris]|nr:hypothetical protein TURU_127449 [Turdus rufiventris]
MAAKSNQKASKNHREKAPKKAAKNRGKKQLKSGEKLPQKAAKNRPKKRLKSGKKWLRKTVKKWRKMAAKCLQIENLPPPTYVSESCLYPLTQEEYTIYCVENGGNTSLAIGKAKDGKGISGIRLKMVENVRLLDRLSSRRAVVGTLYLTATHVIFVENGSETRKETWVLHSQISSIEKQATTATGCPLLIRCKNFQVIQLVIPQERDCHDVYISLIRLARPVKYEELYCFSFNPKLDKEEREQGWKLVDLNEEYNRMGVPNNYWQISDVNRDYGVCDSYPTEVYVPKSATAHIIVGSSKFRSRRRFPALSYYCKGNNASICRSSQPLSGFSARCLEDEQMLQAIRKANPGSDFIYVVDTRPKLNAMANRAAGKGYENEDNYSNIKFQFIGIENIHVMRNSLQKMLEGNIPLHGKLEERIDPSIKEISINALKSEAVKKSMGSNLYLANGTCAMEDHGKY